MFFTNLFQIKRSDSMFYQILLRRKNQIESQLIVLKKEIEVLPSGELHLRRNGDYTKWYNHYDGRIEYITKKQRSLAEQLAIRKYKIALIKELQAEKQAIEAYMKCIDRNPFRASDLLKDDVGFKPLLDKYFNSYHCDIEAWVQESYEKNMAHPEHLIHNTVADFKVRSKSESLIVSALYLNHIPFRYECALHLGEIVIYPDFTILHPITKKIYYYEHFGMMDNPEYAHLTYRKLELYSEHGIVPTINLLTTFETKDHPLDYGVIDKLITDYFLQ